MPKDPHFEVENDVIKSKLRQLAVFLDEVLNGTDRPKQIGFGLFIFSFKGPEFFWISNAERADMVKVLREWIKREEPN